MQLEFFQGWVHSDQMGDQWTKTWKQAAVEAEEENMQLVIMKIPKVNNPNDPVMFGHPMNIKQMEDLELLFKAKFKR